MKISGLSKIRMVASLLTLTLLMILAAFVINALNFPGKIVVDRLVFEEMLVNEFSRITGMPGNNVKADMPDMASLQDYFNTIDPETMRVPRERLLKALEETKTMSDSYKYPSLLTWQEEPADIAGRVRAVAWEPQGNRLWAGAVTGGLWYNDDVASETSPWIPVDDFWPQLSVSCIAIDPNDPQSIYAGTGEAETALIIYRESSGTGFGIVKSNDGGSTWNIIPSTTDFAYVTDILIRDESGISAIYAAVVSGLYMGTQHQSNPSDGLFRSVNGGDTWTQVLPDIPGFDHPYSPSDIAVGADGRIYAGTMQNAEQEGGATILYSDSGAEGTWTVYEEYKTIIENDPQFNLPGRVVLAPAPSDPDIIYALIASGNFNYLPAYECHHIIRSDDRGLTWTEINTPPNSPQTGNWAYIAWHALAGSVDPVDPDILYVGGLDVWRSDNAGTTWSKKTNWTNPSLYNFVHGDIHEILFRGNDPAELIIATDGGVFYTDEGNTAFPSFYERNHLFNTLQTYKAAISPEEGSDEYLAGFQDNGTMYYQGSPVNNDSRITGGDGACCFWDKDEPEIFMTSYQYNRYYFFVNGVAQSSLLNWASGNFISAADYDYKMNTLYANGAWFMEFVQDSILVISGIPDNPSAHFMNAGTGSTLPFTHVKYSPYSPAGTATIFVGNQSGRLFRIDNANTVPQSVNVGDQDFPAGAISCIALGGSEDTILVTFSNYGVSSVWQSYNGGVNWNEVEGNLPDMPVRWALYHPASAKIAMLATETGVWTSTNLNESSVLWAPDNTGLANVRVDILQLRDADNTVVAGTHGRGLFTCTFNAGSITNVANSSFELFNIYPVPAKDHLYVVTGIGNHQVQLEILDSGGKPVMSQYYAYCKTRQLEINIQGFPEGTYLLNIYTQNKRITRKFVKI